jgi:hypothetical protein
LNHKLNLPAQFKYIFNYMIQSLPIKVQLFHPVDSNPHFILYSCIKG